MTKNVIEVSELSAAFDERQVLRKVNFSVPGQQVTVILGGSGSGKTTILKHLLGLYPVDEGRVRIFGRDLASLSEEEQRLLYQQMGVFYQNGALLNNLNVLENIALPLQQHTQLPEDLIAEMVRMKLRLVGLNDAALLFPSQLSGGMLKRAALARAIAMDPPLLFCDEPGAGLDPVSLARLDQLILNLKEQMGITVVMVTHEVSSILRTADHIVFLNEGQIVLEGSKEEALASELPVVREFFGKGTGAY